MNVTIDDIKAIEQELDVELTKEQRDTILKQYQRVVMDNADNWNVIIKDLIKETDAYNRKHKLNH
jgi:hypothetical protein